MIPSLRIGRRPRLFLTLAAMLALLSAAWLASQGRGVSHGLVVEPPIAVLSDRLYRAHDVAQARFRVTNRGRETVVVTALATSCACTVADIEGGRRTPFDLAAGQSVGFRVKMDVAAGAATVQTQAVAVESRAGGRANPRLVATIRVPIEDSLRAEPPSLNLIAAPGESATAQVKLVTNHTATKVAPATLRLSNSTAIQASLSPERPGTLDARGAPVHYVLEAKVKPGTAEVSRSGTIDIVTEGRTVLSIPVSCALKRPYHLSREVIEVPTEGGVAHMMDLFYEASDPAWSLGEVASEPENVDVTIEPFDASTKRLVILIRPQVDRRDGVSDESSRIVLKTKGGHEVPIPLRHGEG